MYNIADFEQKNNNQFGLKTGIGIGGVGGSMLAGRGLNDTLMKLQKKGKEQKIRNQIDRFGKEQILSETDADRYLELHDEIDKKHGELNDIKKRNKLIRNRYSSGLTTLGTAATIGSLILTNRNNDKSK